MSVDVTEQAWVDVLEEITRRSGIPYRLNFAPEDRVTASFRNVSVEEAFQRLFGRQAALVFVYTAGGALSETPAEIWVLARGTTRVAEAASGERAPTPSSERAAEQAVSAIGDAGDDLIEGARTAFDESREAVLSAALSSPSRDVRKLAIAQLGQQGDEAAVGALLELLLQDIDDEIRQNVTSALAGIVRLRQIVESDRKAWGRLNQAMQIVDDPNLRLLAAETLGFPLPEALPASR